MPCDQGRWGPKCSERCNCVNGVDDSCNNENGICQCKPGWRGHHCDLPCLPGFYGENCQKKCSCSASKPCNHVTGECECPPGRTGYGCQSVCSPGRHGKNCENYCACDGENQVCSPGKKLHKTMTWINIFQSRATVHAQVGGRVLDVTESAVQVAGDQDVSTLASVTIVILFLVHAHAKTV